MTAFDFSDINYTDIDGDYTIESLPGYRALPDYSTFQVQNGRIVNVSFPAPDCDFPQDKSRRARRIETNRRLDWSRTGSERRASAQKRYFGGSARQVTHTSLPSMQWELDQAEEVMAPEPIEAFVCPECNLVREGDTCVPCLALQDHDRAEGTVWYGEYSFTPDGQTYHTVNWERDWTNSCTCCGRLGVARPDLEVSVPDGWHFATIRGEQYGALCCNLCFSRPDCQSKMYRAVFDACERYYRDPIYTRWLAEQRTHDCQLCRAS